MLSEKSSLAKAISIRATQRVSNPQAVVDGAARSEDPALLAVAAEQRHDGRDDEGEEGKRQGGAAEASCHSRS